jgi:PEP-CTERM motif
MLKQMSIIMVFAGTALASAPANALTIDQLSIDFIPGDQLQSLRGTVIVEDFEDEIPGQPYGGGLAIFADTVAGQAARPAFGLSTGNFLAVQANQSSAISTTPADPAFSVSILIPKTQVLSFVIGSLDSYNQVILRFLSGAVLTLDGNEIVTPFGTPANGNQTSAATNGRVFYDTLGLDSIIGATFTSNGLNAFEIDNISVAAPEPATWGMMFLAAGMAGAALRRRRGAAMA